MSDQVTRTEAIANFLKHNTHPDLAELYDYNMEVQLNVAEDGGERISGEYKGRGWNGWAWPDGQRGKPFRIPWNASSTPEYEDRPMSFDLVAHAEGIGMTGWDWQNGYSKWVAFDFDAITGHSDLHKAKLTSAELDEVRKSASEVEWVTVRRSTSGSGLHLYVFLDNVPTATHTEHAALARSILGLLSATTGFDFNSKVDACGSNMWVWHRKMLNTNGLQLIKLGTRLHEVPLNWRDHIAVISNRSQKVRSKYLDDKQQESFEQLAGQRTLSALDEEHKALITWLDENKAAWWWDQDHHMLVTHTYHLKEAMPALAIKGIFDTLATGKDRGADINCFLFPLRGGAWTVRRYSKGVAEHESWFQDNSGWTKCFYNREPDLLSAARSAGGKENDRGHFVFTHAEMAQSALLTMGTDLQIPSVMMGHETIVRPHKDGRRVVIEMERRENDPHDKMQDWLLDKKKKNWVRILETKQPEAVETDVSNYDEVVRHLVTEGEDDAGWVVNSNGTWRQEPFIHVKTALGALELSAKEITQVMGASIFKCWTLTSRPFEPEYLGDRVWNRDAPQFRTAPSPHDDLYYPHWQKILEHVGGGLSSAVLGDGWCRANGIMTGADYLKCWLASVFQAPARPLPYLFLRGSQDCGKSIFHESIQFLITKGCVAADNALKSKDNFNGELAGAIICYVEETNLSGNNKLAYERIKSWVTGSVLPIHEKRKTPISVPNTTHWVQCSNERDACPIFPGDTRIVYIEVPDLRPTERIPRHVMDERLEKEAPDFLAALLNLELPATNSRLNIPCLSTEAKTQAEQSNKTQAEIFYEERCREAPGCAIQLGSLFDRFREWLDPLDRQTWGKQKFIRETPSWTLKGRNPKNGQWMIGNIQVMDPLGNYREPRRPASSCKLNGEMLVREDGEELDVD